MGTNDQSETIGARRTREIQKLKRIVDMLVRDYHDPLDDLEAVRLAEIQIETIRIAIVDQSSKECGYSWLEIASALGVTQHEARRTYGKYRPIRRIPSILDEL